MFALGLIGINKPQAIYDWLMQLKAETQALQLQCSWAEKMCSGHRPVLLRDLVWHLDEIVRHHTGERLTRQSGKRSKVGYASKPPPRRAKKRDAANTFVAVVCDALHRIDRTFDVPGPGSIDEALKQLSAKRRLYRESPRKSLRDFCVVNSFAI